MRCMKEPNKRLTKKDLYLTVIVSIAIISSYIMASIHHIVSNFCLCEYEMAFLMLALSIPLVSFVTIYAVGKFIEELNNR